jgi:phosphomevalonate kinase
MNTNETYIVKAPGKLVLLGEYAVLEQGVPAVAASLSKEIYCYIRESDEIIFTSKRINISKVKFKYEDKKVKLLSNVDEIDVLSFSQNAMEIALRYLEEKGFTLKNFEINILSDLSKKYGVKYGFGSSAAVTVSIIGAILYVHGVEINNNANRNVIFKLSSIAHFISQGSGSGVDVAASTFGGLFVYKSYTSEWLREKINNMTSIQDLVNEKWEHFSYQKIMYLFDMFLCVGFTGKSASTRHFIKAVNEMRKTEEGQAFYDKFLKTSQSIIKLFLLGIKDANKEAINKAITANRNLLKELSAQSGIEMETPALTKLIQIAKKYGVSAKFSGAGGGDCGYTIVYDNKIESLVKEDWKRNGIEPVDLKIEETGVCEINFAVEGSNDGTL